MWLVLWRYLCDAPHESSHLVRRISCLACRDICYWLFVVIIIISVVVAFDYFFSYFIEHGSHAKLNNELTCYLISSKLLIFWLLLLQSTPTLNSAHANNNHANCHLKSMSMTAHNSSNICTEMNQPLLWDGNAVRWRESVKRKCLLEPRIDMNIIWPRKINWSFNFFLLNRNETHAFLATFCVHSINMECWS